MSTTTSIGTAEPLVDPDWLADHLDDPTVRIIEVDVSAAAYAPGHIPGATLWNTYTDLRHPDYKPVGTRELEQLLQRCGVGPKTTLAFYGYAAHLGYWLAKTHAHTRAVLIDGPRDQWPGPWSRETPHPTPTTYRIAPATRRLVADDLSKLNGIILDVRSESEYVGERFWPSGAREERGRPGHIPGAINVPISELRTETGFRAATDMRMALHRRGITPRTPVVTYCTIGNRASQAWYALTHLLGFNDAAVYYGGWAEWGSDPTMPVGRK
jgi:thiosulfate/3-mercaptopyruvate sulfurtransferase